MTTKDPKKDSTKPDADGAKPAEKATSAPPFDPKTFGKDALGDGKSPVFTEKRRPARPMMPTLRDDEAIEEARKISLRSVPPGAGSSPPILPNPLNLANRLGRVSSEKDPFEHEAEPPTRPSAALAPTFDEIDRIARTSPPEKPASAPPSGEKPKLPPEIVNHMEMNDRFALGDYSGALDVAEALLENDAADLQAFNCAEQCRQTLTQMYKARIGPLDRVPVVVVAREQLRWLTIDHRAGFVLSHIDGVSSIEMILDVSGMPLLDALKILHELSQQRIINFR